MVGKSVFFSFFFVGCWAVVQSETTSYSFSPNSLSKYNHFVKTPKNNENIQSGGRLIERHLGYLYEAGFQSVLSISAFSTNDTTYNGVSGNFPSSDYEMSIVSSYGLTGKVSPSSLTVPSVKSISKTIDSMPKPLYVHCHVSFRLYLLFFVIFRLLITFSLAIPLLFS
jgi:hypothetical protein